MSQLHKVGSPATVYRGKIFCVQKQKMEGNGKTIEFELARRSPGVRIIVLHEGLMLITKEFRYDINRFDFRLPGGKVFDTLEEFERASASDISQAAHRAAQRESKEEAGVELTDVQLLCISNAGATIEWDLYYFIARAQSVGKSSVEHGENIEVLWKSFEEVKQMCLNGSISEDRTVGVLLRYLLSQKKER